MRLQEACLESHFGVKSIFDGSSRLEDEDTEENDGDDNDLEENVLHMPLHWNLNEANPLWEVW